jgi:hypothetical protein
MEGVIKITYDLFFQFSTQLCFLYYLPLAVNSLALNNSGLTKQLRLHSVQQRNEPTSVNKYRLFNVDVTSEEIKERYMIDRRDYALKNGYK